MSEPFPLKLTAFEQLMLYQHQALHPMVFELHCRLMGQVKREVARAALDAVAPRHPMLLARVENGAWVLSADSRLPLVWDADSGEELHPARCGGARLVVVNEDVLRFEFHHAASDGEGASLFLRDFFRAYQAISEDGALSWRPTEHCGLRNRGRLPWPPASSEGGASLSRRQLLRHAIEFLAFAPAQIKADATVDRFPCPRPVVAHTFSRVQSQRIAQKARSMGSNLNTVALGLLFQSLALQCGSCCSRQPLRVLVPISNRSYSDMRLGAVNRVSYAYLTRHPQEAQSDEGLFFTGLQEEMKYIRQHRPDLILLAGMDLARRFGLLGLASRWSRLQATAILSYMGDLSPRRGYRYEDGYYRVKDFALHSVYGSPPVTAGTPIAVGLGRVGDHLCVGWRSSPALFCQQTEVAMLSDYIDGWRRWAGLDQDDVAPD